LSSYLLLDKHYYSAYIDKNFLPLLPKIAREVGRTVQQP